MPMMANAHAVAADPGLGRPQRRAEGGVGDVGEGLPRPPRRRARRRPGRRRRASRAEQVGAGDPEQLAPAQRPDRLHGGAGPAPPAPGGDEPVPVDRGRETLHKGGSRSAGTSSASSASSRSASGSRVSRSADVAGQAEQPGQPQRDRALVAQQPQEPRRRPERVRDLAVGEQPAVGLGRVGELVQQHRQQGVLDRRVPGHPAGERLQVAQRAGRVLEAEDLQPLRRPPPGSAAAPRWAPGPPPRPAAGRPASRAAGGPPGRA